MSRLWAPLLIIAALLALPFVLAPRPEKSAVAAGSGETDTVVVITAHNKAMRDEYDRAFSAWYRKKFQRDVRLDFRTPGGTSDIVRYIVDRFEAEFRRRYEENPAWGKWNRAIASSFYDARACRTPEQQAARRRFLNSDVGIGIDLFAGGGTFDQEKMAVRGFAVDGKIRELAPEYFRPGVIPPSFGNSRLYDPQGRYYGVVLSTFGILYHTGRLNKLADPTPPARWSDLGAPRFFNLLTVADPTLSGSANKCYEIIVQQCMGARNDPAAGWTEGLNLVKRIFANARQVTESAGGVARDVGSGEAAAGTAIDTYGISEMLWSQKVYGEPRCIYVPPRGGTAVSADPIQLLRGAPHPRAARAFIEFLLSPEGQLLHCLRPGVPGGPVNTGINRPPIRRDLYTPELRKKFFLPGYNPYESGGDFVYRPQWTGRYFDLLRVLLRTIALEPHRELQAAWGAIIRAGGPEKVPLAMAKFNALPFGYADAARSAGLLRPTPQRSAADVGRTLREWGDFARRNYQEAARLAGEGK